MADLGPDFPEDRYNRGPGTTRRVGVPPTPTDPSGAPISDPTNGGISRADLSNVIRQGRELQGILEMQARFTESIFKANEQLPAIQAEVLRLQKESLAVLRDTADQEDRITNSILRRGNIGGTPANGRIDTNHPNRPPVGGATGGTGSPLPGGNPTPGGAPPPAPSPGGGNPTPRPTPGSSGFDPRGLGGINEVLNQTENATRTGSAGSGFTNAGNLAGALGNAIGNIGPAGNMASSIGSSLKAVAPWAIGIGAAVGTANKLAETYADITKAGEGAHGGGFSEGMGYEMSVRSMALNPFISTEQARKIVMSGVQNGFTGKELDTVTEFMAENLKSMNMSVEQSTKLLQTSVIQSGQSVQSLAQDLSVIKNMADSGPMTQQQLNDNNLAIRQTMAGQQIDSEQISADSRIATAFGNIEGHPFQGKNMGNTALQSLNNGDFAGKIAGVLGIGYKDPRQIPNALAKNGDMLKQEIKAMQIWNKEQNTGGSHDDRMLNFQSYWTGGSFSFVELGQLFDSFEQGIDLIGEAENQVRDALGSTDLVDQYAKPGGEQNVEAARQYAGSHDGGIFSGLGKASKTESATDFNSNTGTTGSRFRIEALERIGAGPQDMGVYDPSSGKTFKLNYNNERMMKNIQNGTYKLVQLAKGLGDYSMADDQRNADGWVELSGTELEGANVQNGRTLNEAVENGGLDDGKTTLGSYRGDNVVKINGMIDLSDDAKKFFVYNQSPTGIANANQMAGEDPNRGRGLQEASPTGAYVGSWGNYGG